MAETYDTEHSAEGGYVADIVETIREERGEFILLIGIAVVMVIFYNQSRTLLPQSARVPVIILGMMTVILAVTVVMKLFGDGINAILGIEEGSGFLEEQIEISEAEDDTEGLFDLQPISSIIHFTWISAYLMSLYYIGFWTTNILFPLVYIMVNETSPIHRRFVYFLLWTGLIVAVLWILFVEMMNVQSIWRLGMYP